jgi:hypothetical protein
MDLIRRVGRGPAPWIDLVQDEGEREAAAVVMSLWEDPFPISIRLLMVGQGGVTEIELVWSERGRKPSGDWPLRLSVCFSLLFSSSLFWLLSECMDSTN